MDFVPLIIFFGIAIGVGFGVGFLVTRSRMRTREPSLDSADQFVMIVQHTFRNPLANIKMSADLSRTVTDRREREEIARGIENSANRLLDIVDSFVGLYESAQVDTYVFAAFSFREIVERAVISYQDLITKSTISLSLSIPDTVPLLTADAKKIERAVSILVDNAIRYSKTGGKIVVQGRVKNGRIILTIADEGIGFSSEDTHRIGTKFWRSDAARKKYVDGVGIGLFTAQTIARYHKGFISWTSPGKEKGATYTLVLPVTK